ncbi:MAG: cation transporter [Sphingobacteriales bacterium 17-39-43]|uniref:efflux RND transporter permease subunit n=1 Tax=Daejeonella sp. TaxID=2805397 RepID=UPI000BC4542E|nr:efflux RND transporter permease subunit [Daejeonella sp.]OYZ31635.1 MAG: cation transporter [Sphingobacteriales bacterium 16-39-50]OZA25030.1 MAG: cation transporter [Sphingobacteriales bacterium 17-39-43]OZA62018.1 MAG: cation transporter [Sphingobacteriales bacterium 39-40-5]HQS50282.1 efflux RND transporter permease subunit [Daejeonella sp.]HQT23616.1 efflux RND transporter permease subunit [Daejeonella sp.]
MLNKIIKYFLENKLVTVLIFLAIVTLGVVNSPFNWNTGMLPKDPVPVDAIPDIGENQQIVFTQWTGRSPQDIEDQISYPLTTYLLGIPGVKTIRSSSIFGFSSIYIIFSEDVEFYWSRSRIIEKLNSLPAGLLPDGVTPGLGPDATALGQVYWYTLEGRDKDGNPTGGWDLHEIRTAQDFYVKYGLNAVEGVSEVASIGGYVQEYQIDVNPDALKAYNIPLAKVMQAVQKSNKDVGAKTIEINQAEYLVRGLGYIKKVEDIEKAVVSVQNNVPIRIKDIGVVTLGPAARRGLLDKGGAEVVGGVVVARYGSNPLQVINNVKDKITDLAPGLPKKTLANGVESQLTIVPFYDRTQLIHETIGTLENALSHEVLISIIVVLVLVLNLRASIIISSLLPVGVLMTFIFMRYAGVDANVVALSGIAIAIGVMIDIGIIFVENIIRHLELPENHGVKGKALMKVIYKATVEVASAITTALATTVVSFLPVFAMESAEGKLFRPLAFTKTFALLGAFILGIVVLPALAHFIFGIDYDKKRVRRLWSFTLIAAGILLTIYMHTWLPLTLCIIGVNNLYEHRWPEKYKIYTNHLNLALVLFLASFFLTEEWMPLGPQNSLIVNYIFVLALIGLILMALMTIVHFYVPVLKWCLRNKGKFMLLPLFTILFGVLIWIGFDSTFGFVGKGFEKTGWQVRKTNFWSASSRVFPGIGSEFMPSLNEGSYLLMPTAMPHSGVEYNRKVLGQLDMLLNGIPEVDLAVGKLGRVESALDPAPISMYENVINYKPEFILNENGHRMRFKVDKTDRFITASGDSISNEEGLKRGLKKADLLEDDNGEFYRNWRTHIKSPDDIWDEIVSVTKIPGVTSAPKLQPIETRLVMLQTGMRAPMGIKVYGPDLKTIEDFGMRLEGVLKEVPSVKSEAVFADRIVGKPYLHLNINRDEISRYGLNVEDVQQTIETAIGGMKVTSTVEGRERFPVRVRYPRELRDDPGSLKKILISTPTGAQIPLSQVVDIEYVRGPQVIKSENTFLVGYVLLDKKDGFAEVDVVNDAQEAIQSKIDSGDLVVPAGISYKFSGSYENQIRAVKRLSIVIPISLIIIFLLLYFQFKTVIASSIHFSGVFVAFAGGFIMLWLYGQGWFLNFAIADVNMRDLFQMHTINLSVAVWVGFIALFGIATDDGVIMGTYIHQVFEEKNPKTIEAVREAVVIAGQKRVRPAMMTAAVAIIALLPVLTSTGKGADIMIPMAIPTFGGMTIQIMTMFVVPVLQAFWRETVIKKQLKRR